jgi:hypothetical protein
MSPVATDCASADSTPGEVVALEVVGVATVAKVLVPVEAVPFEAAGELLDVDPQPATTITDASATGNA